MEISTFNNKNKVLKRVMQLKLYLEPYTFISQKRNAKKISNQSIYLNNLEV